MPLTGASDIFEQYTVLSLAPALSFVDDVVLEKESGGYNSDVLPILSYLAEFENER